MTTSPEQIITDTWREFTEDLAARLGDLAPGRFDFLECFRASDRLQLITFRATRACLPILSVVVAHDFGCVEISGVHR